VANVADVETVATVAARCIRSAATPPYAPLTHRYKKIGALLPDEGHTGRGMSTFLHPRSMRSRSSVGPALRGYRDQLIFVSALQGARMRRKRYMLYVASDLDRSGRFCPGSRECIALIQANPVLLPKTRFENVDVIRREGPLPAWLYGTPTLVDTDLKRIMRGTSARDFLVGMAPDVEIPDPPASSAVEASAVPRNDTSIRDEPRTDDSVQSKGVSEYELACLLNEREMLDAKLMSPRIGAN